MCTKSVCFFLKLFTYSFSSQLKFQWEIAVIASTMSFNCDEEYRFKVTNCLCFVYMYVYKVCLLVCALLVPMIYLF
jgi:hypothetical protein